MHSLPAYLAAPGAEAVLGVPRGARASRGRAAGGAAVQRGWQAAAGRARLRTGPEGRRAGGFSNLSSSWDKGALRPPQAPALSQVARATAPHPPACLPAPRGSSPGRFWIDFPGPHPAKDRGPWPRGWTPSSWPTVFPLGRGIPRPHFLLFFLPLSPSGRSLSLLCSPVLFGWPWARETPQPQFAHLRSRLEGSTGTFPAVSEQESVPVRNLPQSRAPRPPLLRPHSAGSGSPRGRGVHTCGRRASPAIPAAAAVSAGCGAHAQRMNE